MIKIKHFKDFLLESLENINKNKGENEISLFIGRLQPPTKAHIDILNDILSKNKKLLICIVRGEKSSQDKEKNPFPFNMQIEILEKCLKKSNYEIIEIKTAFIGDIVNYARNKNEEIVELYCGTDRYKTYKSQIDRYKDQLNLNIEVKEISRTDEDISATKVRESLKNNDENTFKSMMCKEVHSLFSKLQLYIK